MLEKYYNQKIRYKDYVILIKCGSFYEAFEKDALIINTLLKYKIKKFSKTFKSGFPTLKLNVILKILEENHLNYVVLDEIEMIKKEFDDNKYQNFNFDIDRIMLNYIKIDKIMNYLNDNILNERITDILEKMEELLWRIIW